MKSWPPALVARRETLRRWLGRLVALGEARRAQLGERLALFWRRYRRHTLALAVLALLSLALWFDRFARLRVINTLADPVELWVDGRARAWLLPVTTETPEAGFELRLSPGFHRLVLVTTAGVKLDELEANMPAHSRYLFAPSTSGQCFWVEHTAYGQARPTMPASRPLPPEQRLWLLPDEIDAWFFPTPPASADRRSSGGHRTAIRQVRCGFEP